MVVWIATVLALLAFGGCFVLGLRLGRRGARERLTLAVAAGCAALLIVRAVLRFHPQIDYALLPFDLYAVLRPWWAFPFVFLVTGIGARRMSTRFSRRGVGVCAGLLFFFAASRLVATALIDPADFEGVPGAEGNCPQTSDYSCGAAAAATLLARLGVTADEGEMVGLCGTTALSGTDEFGVCRGLRKKLGAGYRIEVVRTDWEGLRRRPLPAMAIVAHSFLIDHWVVVLESDASWVLVGDPLISVPTRMTRERFLQKWRRVLVVVERGPDGARAPDRGLRMAESVSRPAGLPRSGVGMVDDLPGGG